MNARFYVPNTNRFLTPDTIIPDPTNPQDFNRYSYVRNNPIRYTDPTGHYIPESDEPGNYDCGGQTGLISCEDVGIENGVCTTPYDCVYPAGSEKAGNLILDAPPATDVNPNGPRDYRSSRNLAAAGTILDIIELILLNYEYDGGLGPIKIDDLVAGMDILITIDACWEAGQCFWKDEDGDGMEEVLVVNQDIMITLADTILGFYDPLDKATTSFSLFYDISDFLGLTPNLVSFGLTTTGIYVYQFDGNGTLVSTKFYP